MARRVKLSRAPSKLAPGLMGVALVAVGFATLMIRLEVVQEGYRLSALRREIAELQESNRTLRLEQAQLSSHQRLRALAVKYRMSAPARGQVVVVP